MTAPAPSAHAPAARAQPARSRPAGRFRRITQSGGTPAALRSLLIGLTAASLAWGVLAAWTVSQHASAASQVVTTSEPLSFAAQQMYASLSDADVTATTAFLAGPPEPLSVRQRYEADIAQAGADLATLRAATGGSANAALASSLAAVAQGLPVYSGYVQQALTYSSLGHPLTGGSFMQVASEEMHLTLLPAARAIYAAENDDLTAASASATGLPLMIVAIAAAIAIAIALLRTQRWLRRRTHRSVNYGLLAATLAVIIGTVWLATAYATARSDLQRGLGSGSTPAEILAQAGISAQQARGDEVLNLISRSGSTSFQQDFTAMRDRIGPGSGTLLTTAAAQSPAGPPSSAVAAAERDARSWYTSAGQVFRLDLAASYAAETHLVIGHGLGSSAAGFARLEADLRRAIAADQAEFRSGASAGSAAFSGLEAVVIVAALVMAAGSAWGVSRRLREYR
jgi:hypothetical protein